MTATADTAVADLQRANAELQRQLGEYRAERDEAFAQQTATAEVLQVINASPGDLAPVFDAMVERAVRLCEADEAAVRTFDGELLHLAAAHGDPAVIDTLRQLGPSIPVAMPDRARSKNPPPAPPAPTSTEEAPEAVTPASCSFTVPVICPPDITTALSLRSGV